MLKTCLAGLTALLALALPAKTASASAAPYVQMNIYGAGHPDDEMNAQYLTYAVAGLIAYGMTPWAISLNEVCEGSAASASQLHTIFNYLTTQGYYQVNYTAQYNPNGGPSGMPHHRCDLGFGNVVYGWGTAPPTSTFAGAFTKQHIPPKPNPENRGIACGAFSSFGLTHTACSTHLMNSTNTAVDQLAEAVAVQNNTVAVHPGFAHYLGGDLNLCYFRVRENAPGLYASHYELNGEPAYESDNCDALGGQPYYTVAGPYAPLGWSWTVKYDYGFLHKAGFSGPVLPPGRINTNANPVVPASPISDHAFYSGMFTYP